MLCERKSYISNYPKIRFFYLLKKRAVKTFLFQISILNLLNINAFKVKSSLYRTTFFFIRHINLLSESFIYSFLQAVKIF